MNGAGLQRNALPAGTEVTGHRLEAVLGAGGFGITYLAFDPGGHRRVALKEYLPSDIAVRAPDGSVVPLAAERRDDYRAGLELFLHEARTLASFGHPHVVPVTGCFEANGTAYMVMEYEHGESLGHLLKQVHTLPEARLRSLLTPLLDGLRAVHEAGFLHRDIKPSNIFLRDRGGPMLIDFGAARFTLGAGATRTAVVTPGYAPIEQYSSDGREGPWSDIYALAAVFFRAVTGDDPPDANARRRRDSVPMALAGAQTRYGAHLLACLGWAMERDMRRRPQSVSAWLEALEGGRVPYALARNPAESRADEARRGRTIAPYRWAVPVAVALAVVTWRAYEARTSRDAAAPAAATSPAPARSEPAAAKAPPAAGGDPSPTVLDGVRERPTRERTTRPGRER